MEKISKLKLILVLVVIIGALSSINFIGAENSDYDKISGTVNYNTVYKELASNDNDANLSHIITIVNHIDADMHAEDFRIYREELVNLSYRPDTIKSINKYSIQNEIDSFRKYLGKVQLVKTANGQYKIKNREYIDKTILNNNIKQILIKVNGNVK